MKSHGGPRWSLRSGAFNKLAVVLGATHCELQKEVKDVFVRWAGLMFPHDEVHLAIRGGSIGRR